MKVLHSICQQIWNTQQWPQDWKMSVFILIPKKGNAKECSNFCTIAFISHANKVMLKTLQARLQQYMNHEIPDVQAGFRKGRGTINQFINICWVIEKQESSRNTSTSASLTMPKPLTVWITKLLKILQEMGIPDDLTCLLRNLYAGQEVTVRTGHGTTAAAAAAKSLQSCLTLCSLIDSIPPGSSIHRIPQSRTLEWAANFLLQCMHVCTRIHFSHV